MNPKNYLLIVFVFSLFSCTKRRYESHHVNGLLINKITGLGEPNEQIKLMEVKKSGSINIFGNPDKSFGVKEVVTDANGKFDFGFVELRNSGISYIVDWVQTSEKSGYGISKSDTLNMNESNNYVELSIAPTINRLEIWANKTKAVYADNDYINCELLSLYRIEKLKINGHVGQGGSTGTQANNTSKSYVGVGLTEGAPMGNILLKIDKSIDGIVTSYTDTVWVDKDSNKEYYIEF